jgi:hypothetical protein
MADSAPPALPEAGQRAAEALLTKTLGEPAVEATEPLWDRGHIFRLRLTSGRTVILKRKRREWPIGAQLFGDELAALDYLNGMPAPVAPGCSVPMRRPGRRVPRPRADVRRGPGPRR